MWTPTGYPESPSRSKKNSKNRDTRGPKEIKEVGTKKIKIEKLI